ncbi:unnamed protein product [Tuber aestivum]|uniref:Uncharacterized protein n=1 Tax=Tuber aestivum TaxID=59557 RepID=A0A292PS66_9PEZI|nr:unnamed protein product [Tuber aestivum]
MTRLIVNKQAFKAISIHPYHSHRGFGTVPRRNTDSDSHHVNDHHHDSSGGCAGFGSPPGITWKDFVQLDKDVFNIKLKLDHIQSGQSEMRADVKVLNSRMDKNLTRPIEGSIITRPPRSRLWHRCDSFHGLGVDW